MTVDAEYCHAQCRFCRVFIVVLSVVMLSVMVPFKVLQQVLASTSVLASTEHHIVH